MVDKCRQTCLIQRTVSSTDEVPGADIKQLRISSISRLCECENILVFVCELHLSGVHRRAVDSRCRECRLMYLAY